MPRILSLKRIAIPAVERCCLSTLDRRFVVLVQLALFILSLNLQSAFSISFVSIIIAAGIATVFMVRGHVWAFALAKITALGLFFIYGVDMLSQIPLMPFSALSHEVADIPFLLSEALGVWLSCMLLANLRPVPIRALIQNVSGEELPIQ